MDNQEKNKIALAACSGMSPYGLITRVACSDTIEESDNLISICMGATSADREGFRELIKKYPIITVNGCESSCADKILIDKGVKVKKSINAMKVLKEVKLKPKDVSRLDAKGEESVKALKHEIKSIIAEISI